MSEIMVTKGDGTLEPLDMHKIQFALAKAGASKALSEEVIDEIAPKLHQNITTKEIFSLAFKSLNEMRPGAAARFGLKAALFKMGPEGYPFETFVAALLRGRKYETKLRQIVRGKCVQHEIDVIARRPPYEGKPKMDSIVECKFHNDPAIRCRIQSALYSWARFLDIRDAGEHDITSAWLVTNTKFTSDVIQYADCVGLRLLGWSFPASESIQVRIEENRLYPLTVMNSLDRRTFLALHDAGYIIVSDIVSASERDLAALRLPQKTLARLHEEAHAIMSHRG